MGPQDQPDFINCVAKVTTKLEPLELLTVLQSIEVDLGRVKGERWGARLIDLDILIYGQLQLESPTLTIPHAGITQRNFVLVPLSELDENIVIPGVGTIVECLRADSSFMDIKLEKI